MGLAKVVLQGMHGMGCEYVAVALMVAKSVNGYVKRR